MASPKALRGLSSEEAERLLKRYGYNEIKEERLPLWRKLLSYFWNPIAWMVELAMLTSLYIGHWAEFWITAFLLFLNGAVRFFEEHKAESIVEYLKRKMAITTYVLRDGKWVSLEARYIVPGDVMKLLIGNVIPADAEVVDGYLLVDESMLTGESLPVEKRKGDTLFAGSIVKRGEAIAVVKKTGVSTYFGRAISLVEHTREKSEFQKAILSIGDFLIRLALVLVLLVIVVEAMRGTRISHIVEFASVLIVAAIPAALPAVLSVTLAKGAMELAKKDIIVSRLTAIEDLSGVDVLASDKTGTLTTNKLSVVEVKAFTSSPQEVLRAAALASEEGNPIDNAILERAKKLSVKLVKPKKFVPFSPETRRTEAEVVLGGKKLKVAKGAVKELLKLTRFPKAKVGRIVEEWASKGYRAVAVARKRTSWELLGLIALYDKPREDAKEAVSLIKSLGVRVKVVSGDHKAVVKTIAEMLGIGKVVYAMDEVRGKPHAEELIEKADGFAEVYPEDKYTIIESLEKKGHYVAMTGDGVNDVPALKKAHCGIAVANATDAARSAADIILLSPGISVIAHAIRKARQIFARMEAYATYRVAETIRVLLFMAASIIFLNFYPITTIMIVLLAILNDIPILTISIDNSTPHPKPTRWRVKEMLKLSTLLGITGVISSFTLLYIGDVVLGLSKAMLQSLIFLKLVVAGHSTLFIARSKEEFWKPPYPHPILFLAIFSTDLIATLLSSFGVLVPKLPLPLVALVWFYSMAWMLINDVLKLILLKHATSPKAL